MQRALISSTVVAFVCGGVVAYLVATLVFNIGESVTLVTTLGLLLLLLPIGYFKTIVQFSYLFKRGRYGTHFLLTFAGTAVFLVACSALALGPAGAASMALARLSADIAYLSTALIRFGSRALAA
jgi:hypothetical protein